MISVRLMKSTRNIFKEPFPARSCVEVARLPKDVLLEVEAIAWK